MKKKPKRFDPRSRWIKYRDGLWLPSRKRVYLYWFKFLQIADQDPNRKVDWRKYRGWGGANEVMGCKFDDWWNDHWKDLFAVPSKGADLSKVKFPLTTRQPKTEAIRISWLVWLHRDTPADYTPMVQSSCRWNVLPETGFKQPCYSSQDHCYRETKSDLSRTS